MPKRNPRQYMVPVGETKVLIAPTGHPPPSMPISIGVVIPAYNEEATIAEVIRSCIAAGFPDVIVVDDGSADATASEAREAGARVVRHPINRGAGAATETGLEIARHLGMRFVVITDADGQHDPSDLRRLLSAVEGDGADIAIGSRFLDPGNTIPVLRRAFNAVANVITFALTGIRTSDSQSGMKAFGPQALDKVRIRTDGFEFCTEIFQEIGYHGLRFVEVPVTVRYDEASMRKGQNFSTGLSTVAKLFLRSLMR